MELGAYNFHEALKRHVTDFNGARERQVISKRGKPQGRVVFEAVNVMAFNGDANAEMAASVAVDVVVRVRGPCIDPGKADEASPAFIFEGCRYLPFPAVSMGAEAEPGTFDADSAVPGKWDHDLSASPSSGAQFPPWCSSILWDRRRFRDGPFRPADRLFRNGCNIAPCLRDLGSLGFLGNVERSSPKKMQNRE
jgi:hypothetical protein